MTVKYKKITRKTWDFTKKTPKCPSKGAFEISYYNATIFVIDGKLHKENGPAEIWPSGSLRYYQNGKLHRTDGPAWVDPNGTKVYYFFGKEYKKKQWESLVLQLNLKEQIV